MAAVESKVCDFGWPAVDFDLPATDGRRYTLKSARGENGLLVMFICNHCPFVKSIRDRIARDARDLLSYGIGTIAIMSNDPAEYPEDGFEEMKRVAERHAFSFAYAFDETQEVARAYGAQCTPEFYGFNSNLELQYRGRLDESRRETVPDAPRELFEAMKQIALTGSGPATQVPSIGCSIKWKADAANG